MAKTRIDPEEWEMDLRPSRSSPMGEGKDENQLKEPAEYLVKLETLRKGESLCETLDATSGIAHEQASRLQRQIVGMV